LVAVLGLLGAGGATFVLAGEQIEHVVAPEEGALRPPSGEWIASVKGASAEIWAVGDAEPPAENSVARLIKRGDPDRILYLGDVYPDGNPDDFRRWAKPWGRFVRRMAPTPGNHDWPEAREGYEPYWKQVTGETPPTYYAFRAGGWQILSVNSEHDEQGAVDRWLRHKVRSEGNCRIAFWHRPNFSAGEHPGDDVTDGLWESLQGRARLVVNGHDHNMQRFQPIDGMVEFVSGAGGRAGFDVDEDYPRLSFSNDQDLGALRLKLSSGTARWAFIAVGGRVLDSGRLTCQQ
jgi:hypothetical protein